MVTKSQPVGKRIKYFETLIDERNKSSAIRFKSKKISVRKITELLFTPMENFVSFKSKRKSKKANVKNDSCFIQSINSKICHRVAG